MTHINQLIDGLNPQQKAAVQYTEGPLLIMAGAGSGKTRVLTHRMAYLLEEKAVRPWNILAITFTNKAANEMKERVKNLVGEAADTMWVSTFHSMCVRILRREAEAIGLSRSFTIADPAEQQSLIKRIMKDHNLDTTQFKPKMILGKISDAKNNLLGPKEYRQEYTGFIENIVADLYEDYQAGLQAAQSLDFDDLIMLTVRLFKEQPEILSYYQQKFHYIHVDEYQDTNEAQYRLVKLLADYFKNICVVGDADQSIYGWRGANMENILNFEKDYPQAKVILLEQNYRSTKTILKAANEVIQNNVHRQAKKLWTDNQDGGKINYYRAQNEQDESHYVLDKIRQATTDKNYQYKDIAILYRTNAQSRTMEEALVKANIPYRIVGGLKFYDRKEIKDVLAYLRLLTNPQDNLSFTRIINVPKRGIGPGTLDKLRLFASEHGLTLLQAAQKVDYAPISGKGAKSLKKFADMMTNLQKQREFLTITDLTEEVLDKSGYLADLKAQKTLEATARVENIEEFLSVTRAFDERWEKEADQRQALAEITQTDQAGNPVEPVNIMEDSSQDDQAGEVSLLSPEELDAGLGQTALLGLDPGADASDDALLAFITDLSLVSDLDDSESNEEEGQVTLMPLHAAKGLEFPIVFIIGMEEGIFPLSRASEDDEELEEERRLAYVGITRAEEELYLTNSYSRMLYGQHKSHPESRFITEIDDELLAKEDHSPLSMGSFSSSRPAYYNRRSRLSKSAVKAQEKRSIFAKGPSQSQGKSSEEVEWQVGDKARHKVWGVGTVVKVTGSDNDQELDIAFKGQGIKRLLAAFAPISKED
ncbi:UvrD-helicase domain-containing protein [Aerococcus loyolae]|uniref:UvrD-helicase domain-containing protein n=1 Tax=Aerococcus loyolae TaxID=2976809 RepID=UPI0008A588AD|nr:UvrD-helicase domain-containing protein [Aerococcus loyolae]OFL17320.1 ATP-dependent DNA helicase PcrA [Aerococcus loyolae]